MTPLLHSTRDQHHLLWHPKKHELWLLAFDRKELWRVNEAGGGELLFDAAALGLTDVELKYSHASGLYFDTGRDTPVWFVAGYDRLFLFALGKKTFGEVKQRGGLAPAGTDAFVFDPRRKVLVHFCGPRADAGAARASLTVRELGPDGTWRDVGTPVPSAKGMYTVAGWDEASGQSVFVDDAHMETWAWNGSAWTKLGRYPSFPWRPFFAGSGPRGELVIVQKQRSEDEKAQCFQLSGGKWASREVNGLTEWGGMAHGFIAGPWFGPGTVQHSLGRYDGKTFTPAGRPAPVLTLGSVAGTPRFFGSRQQVRTNAARVPPLRFLRDGAGLALAGQLPEGIAYFADSNGDFTLTAEGALLLQGKPHAKPAKGFVAREETNFGGDGQGALLVVGGEVSYGAKRLTDVWRFTTRWERLSPTGAAPAVAGGNIALHRPSDTWVVLGGRGKDFRRPNVTSELVAEKKWSTFPTKLSDEKKSPAETWDSISLLASDARTGELLCVRSAYGRHRVYAYRGKGAWELLASLDAESLSAFAWDSQRRVLVGAGPDEVRELDLTSKLRSTLPAEGTPRAGVKKLADEVWLRLREGDRDLFWFARRERGGGWLERSGVRGQPGKKKHHAKAETYEVAVQAKLDAGYEHSPEQEKTAILPGRTAFRMKLGKRGDDLFGGVPPAITERAWPKCRECKTPMTHIATFHAHPERLPLKRHVALAAFVCTNEETAGICETWDESLGSNAVVLLRSLKGGLRRAPGDACAARRIAYTPEFEVDPAAGENAKDPEAFAKVNGFPGWPQGDDTPSCPRCKKAMRFVAQVPELDPLLNFASGDAYVFVCESEHTGALLCQR